VEPPHASDWHIGSPQPAEDNLQREVATHGCSRGARYAHDYAGISATREALAHIAEDELGGVSLDEALQIVLFEHQTTKALARLAADPEAMDEYRGESASIAEADELVVEW
jgi:hypothetical protein